MAHEEHRSRGVFERFVHSEVSGSAVLLGCAVAALVWANSPWSAAYFELARTEIGLSWGGSRFALSLQHWINDLLMAVFFFVVGLEIKRELVVGQLSSPKKALLPVSAAIGGMALPALLFTALNSGGEAARGWAIPMATDIAFALGLLSLFGRRVPVALKVFLTALAIADDLGAVLVIALFYTARIDWAALLLAGVSLFSILLANRARVRQPGVYVLLALGAWLGVFGSGLHPSVAGILVALLVPVRARRDQAQFLALLEARLQELKAASLTRESTHGERSQLDAISDLHEASGDMEAAGLKLEEQLHPVVAFLILPLFALFNAGVAIDGSAFAGLAHPVSLGIVGGLVLGKQIGIMLFCWLAVKSGRAELPEGLRWEHVYGGACLAGIGFTMSLFIGELAFSDDTLLARAKLGILTASLVAALWGAGMLNARLGRARRAAG